MMTPPTAGMRGDMGPEEVAEGIYRVGTRWVYFYLLRDRDDVTLIDAGYPGYLNQLRRGLENLRLGLDSIAAVLVTHHHIDHVGTAEAIRTSGRARILVGADDAERIAGRVASHPPSGFYREAWRPSMIRYLVHTVGVGGASYKPVASFETVDDDLLDLPGRPRIILTPGHTRGHFSVLVPDRGVLFTGDALLNFDYATGETGPKLHRFNEDRDAALSSLQLLDDLETEVVLFAHGDPWNGDAKGAVEHARQRAATGT